MMGVTGPRRGIALIKGVIPVVVLLALGAGGFFAWSKLSASDGESEQTGAEAEDEAPEKKPELATETLSLGEFLVNPRTSDGSLRYLQTEISVVVVAEREEGEEESGGHGGGEADEEAELPPASHRYARDVAIEVLASQSFERLRDASDRTKLKATLQQKLDAALEDYQVRDVLFTAFVMQ